MRVLCLAVMLFAVSLVNASAGVEGSYGHGVTLPEVTPVSAIFDAPQNYVGKRVLIEGMIVDVCTSRGCWMFISGDRPYEKIRVKVTDGEIVFPVAAQGHIAQVEGVVQELRRSKQDVINWKRHLAEERGEEFDPSTVTGPEVTYRLRGLGAVIR
mgnify:CR=1 FL=1